MNIIYISSTCSRAKYTEYVESKGIRVSQQAQKYNLLLAEGFVVNGANVCLLSSRPINRSVERRLWMKGEREQANGIDFYYVPFINYPVLRNISVLLGVFFRILFSGKKKADTVVVCDALNIVATMAAQAAAALRGYETVGIVTDVPCYFSDMEKIPFYQKLNLAIMRKFKSYLLLTEPMSKIVNPKKHPYIVLEGHADMDMEGAENRLEQKDKKQVCLYAGSLMKIYGIESLVKGFIAADIPEAELHIYGSGDYVEELKELVRRYDRVKYLGVVPNSEIIKAELAATLLVNPRPTNEEYTKYSFPSKNMEYMASGTPVLTTRLPGMPKDHEPYVYFIKEETPEGIKAALEQVLANDAKTLHAFGAKAKAFILQEKSNQAQAGKVLAFIKTVFAMEEV